MTFNKLQSDLTYLGLIFASFVSGYWVCEHFVSRTAAHQVDELGWREQDLLDNFGFVQDGLARWAGKNGKTKTQALEIWKPQVMAFDDRQCVQFVTRRANIGSAAPVYCYSYEGTDKPNAKLVYVRDDLSE